MPIPDHPIPAPTLGAQRRDQRRRVDLEPPRRIVRHILRDARPLDPIAPEQQAARFQRRGLRRRVLDYIDNTA